MGIYEAAIQVTVTAIAQAQMLRDDDLTAAAISAIRAFRAAMEEWEKPTPVAEVQSSTFGPK